MFKSGQKKARKILNELLGKKHAKALWKGIYWSFSDVLPKHIDSEYPEIKWMGFCAPMVDGTNTIMIHPGHHNDSDEVAFTIGHELAHALQNIVKGAGNANHDDEIFVCFRKAYCDTLGFTEDSF